MITRLHTNIIEAEISGGSSQGNRLFIGGDVTVRFETRFVHEKQPVQKCQPLVHSALG